MTYEALENPTLLMFYASALGHLEEARISVGFLEQEIMRRMRVLGATSIPSELFTCELEVRNTLDPSRLVPLKEKLLPADLESAWTPAHEETREVPESWNGVKLNALARRYGGEVARIIAEAKVPGNPHLRFKRKGD